MRSCALFPRTRRKSPASCASCRAVVGMHQRLRRPNCPAGLRHRHQDRLQADHRSRRQPSSCQARGVRARSPESPGRSGQHGHAAHVPGGRQLPALFAGGRAALRPTLAASPAIRTTPSWPATPTAKASRRSTTCSRPMRRSTAARSARPPKATPSWPTTCCATSTNSSLDKRTLAQN